MENSVHFGPLHFTKIKHSVGNKAVHNEGTEDQKLIVVIITFYARSKAWNYVGMGRFVRQQLHIYTYKIH